MYMENSCNQVTGRILLKHDMPYKCCNVMEIPDVPMYICPLEDSTKCMVELTLGLWCFPLYVSVIKRLKESRHEVSYLHFH